MLQNPLDAFAENCTVSIMMTEFRAGSQKSKAYAMRNPAIDGSLPAFVHPTEIIEIDSEDNFLLYRNLRIFPAV
jgi:hypothetical protein